LQHRRRREREREREKQHQQQQGEGYQSGYHAVINNIWLVGY
jgi:hypothetical protein